MNPPFLKAELLSCHRLLLYSTLFILSSFVDTEDGPREIYLRSDLEYKFSFY